MLKQKWILAGLLLHFSPIFASTPQPIPTDMVVSEEKIASQVGADILHQGGNAIDAAVAVGYALAVTDPCCGNIGGGGFMTIRFANGKETVFNFREKAPHKAYKTMFVDAHGQPVDEQSVKGYRAVAVPGTVLGLDTALQKYGKLSRQQVMAPAIELAEHGFIITPFEAKRYQPFVAAFRAQPNVAAIFLDQGHSLPAGYRLIQKNLANTLRLIAKQGPNAFYNGPIAQTIVKESQLHGGLLSLEDFKQYHVAEVAPLHCQYHGYTIIAPPPPSSGVTLCEMLTILNALPANPHPATRIRDTIEAMRYAFIDRNSQLADPDFHDNPVETLLSPAYAKQLATTIIQSHSPPPHQSVVFHKELTDTTHYSVMDQQGNAVSVTYTINGFFGAQVIAGDTGFFLNDEMDDFTMAPGIVNKFGLMQSPVNDIAPGKRPYSSMTPIIVTKNNQVYLVAGSPGGPRIITSVLLTLLNLIDKHLSLQAAINAPRYHYQVIPDAIDLEPNALPQSTQRLLQQWGYHFTSQPTWGALEVIKRDPQTHHLEGANDYRRPDGGVAFNHLN